MIIKYSEGSIEGVVTPKKDEEELFTKKTREAVQDDSDLVKEASKEDKPFWVKK